MQLFLVKNDPLHTLLVSQHGEPRYSIHSTTDAPDDSPSSGSSSTSSSSSSSSGSASSSTSFTSAEEDVTPQNYRKPPARLHSTSPIARTHSTPHPDVLKNYEDSSSLHPFPILSPSSSPCLVTSIKRLDRPSSSRGNIECQIGRVEYSGDDSDLGTRVQLCNLGMELCAPAIKRRKSAVDDETQTALVSRRNDTGTALNAFRDFCLEAQRKMDSASLTENSPPEEQEKYESRTDPTWSFKGPDNRSYKWVSLFSNPVLYHDTQPPIPIACYRPAKLGIISRSRRGFLEILPEGLEKEDWIVSTFVGYSRMKMGAQFESEILPSIDMAKGGVDLPIGISVGGHWSGVMRKSASAPTTPAAGFLSSVELSKSTSTSSPSMSPRPCERSPQRSPSAIGKLPTSSSALASLEALRRNNKNYGVGPAAARRTR